MNEADWQGLLNWTANGQSVKLERTQRETEWAQGSIPPTKTEARASFTADSTTAILIIIPGSEAEGQAPRSDSL